MPARLSVRSKALRVTAGLDFDRMKVDAGFFLHSKPFDAP